ncbi:MAG: YSC84-related protein [Verrucomicrobiota bacterium]
MILPPILLRGRLLGWLAAVLLAGGIARAAGPKPGEIEELRQAVPARLESFQKADSTLAARLQAAAGYVIFPRIGKGGFVVGGARGQGLVYEGGRAVGSATLSQVTVGAQIGGQSYAQLILFEDRAALERFKAAKFEMSAQVSAVVAAEGQARAARYEQGLLVFTQPLKGLMAEASVGGQKFVYSTLP